MRIRAPATSRGRALGYGAYAVRAGPSLWMSFDSPDHAWVARRFSRRGLTHRAQWLAGLVERSAPAVRADFDVYHEDGLLLYTDGECGDGKLAPVFFLHVYPVNEDDLPANRRRYDNLDFRFGQRRVEDELVPSRVGCAAVVGLPNCQVARIRTGQTSGGRPLWMREFEVLERRGDSTDGIP